MNFVRNNIVSLQQKPQINQLSKKKMQLRLMAENTIRFPFEGIPYFSASALFLAYRACKAIKVRSINKNVKQIELPHQQQVIEFSLFQFRSITYLIVLEDNYTLKIFALAREKDRIQHRLIGQIENVLSFKGHAFGLLLLTSEGFLKIVSPNNQNQLSTGNIQTIDKCEKDSKIVEHQGNTILLLQSGQNSKYYSHYVFSQEKGKFEKVSNLEYLATPYAFYRDRYILHGSKNKGIEIYDLEWEKIIGKFQHKGEVLHVQLKNNLLFIVTSNENSDSYLFYILNGESSESQNKSNGLVSHHCSFEKGKGSYFQYMNYTKDDISAIISKQENFCDKKIDMIDKTTESLIYVIPKNKNKLETIRISHSKIIQYQFAEQKMNLVVPSKKLNQKVRKDSHSLEVQRQRMNAAMQNRKGQKSAEQLQKNFIQFLIESKIKIVMDRFSDLERRIISLEEQITKIYGRIQQSFNKLHREEIRKNVENLFHEVTPQFQDYFGEVFKQISGVLDEGVTYYNNKLAKEAELHKESMNQLLNMTFDATQEVIELGRQELKFSQKTKESVNRLIEMRKLWESQRKENYMNLKSELANRITNHKVKLEHSSKKNNPRDNQKNQE